MDIDYDPLLLADDPYPTYRRLRSRAPVYQGQVGNGVRFWALSRYADVEAAALDWRTFSSAQGNDLDDTGLLFGPEPAMDCTDPPQHTRMRRVLKREFGPTAVREHLGPLIRRKVREAVDGLSGREFVDFADELAYPLPAGLIWAWLGFPDGDHDQLRRWHSGMLERDPGVMEMPDRAVAARDQLWAYLTKELAARCAEPRDDLLSVLARAAVAGELTRDEVLANVLFLFDAGIVSTNAAVAGALLHLRAHQDQWSLLRAKPEVVRTGVEEFLRFDAPFHWFKRVTTRDVELHGVHIPAGERVLLIWAAANRDERRWTEPERLRLDRPIQQHLSFNIGIHHCLGNVVVRLELDALFRELAARIVDYEIVGPVVRRVTPSERTIVRLPARVRWVA